VASGKPSLMDISDQEWEQMMHINTTSCFLAVKYAAAAMQKVNSDKGKDDSSGSIIMTASVAGLRSGAGTVHCEY
jgi:NAD(P)-dependent dehydrogenase (short-subunit alcohol dehydrogenase family)